ncbi:hypothetical protein Tco_1373590 [Tanacetum coccineum]
MASDTNRADRCRHFLCQHGNVTNTVTAPSGVEKYKSRGYENMTLGKRKEQSSGVSCFKRTCRTPNVTNNSYVRPFVSSACDNRRAKKSDDYKLHTLYAGKSITDESSVMMTLSGLGDFCSQNVQQPPYVTQIIDKVWECCEHRFVIIVALTSIFYVYVIRGAHFSLGIVAGERFAIELTPSTFPQRHFAGDRFPQRHVAGEKVGMLLGKASNVVVIQPVRNAQLCMAKLENFIQTQSTFHKILRNQEVV